MATAARSLQTSERPLTIEDFESFPDDGNSYEIIGGLLAVTPASTLEHQRIVGRLFAALARYFDDRGGGEAFLSPVDVELSTFDVVEPDIVVVLDENAPVKHVRRIVGAPDLVIEVISLSSSLRDRVQKAALYALNGVKEYRLVDTVTRTVVVQSLRSGTYETQEQRAGLAHSRLLEGFEMDLERLFRGPTASASMDESGLAND